MVLEVGLRGGGEGAAMEWNQELHGAPRPLSLRRAARRVGLSLEVFKAEADALNGTPEDLRLPGTTRNPARYDPERLNRWKQARLHPGPNVLEVTAQWTETGWLLYAPRYRLTSRAPRLVTAKRRIIQDLAVAANTEPGNLILEIRYDPNHPAIHAWSEAAKLKDQANDLLEQATRMREMAIQLLTDEGMTRPEIGAAFGLSHQRIQQLQAASKARPDSDSSEHQAQTRPRVQ